MTQQLTRDEMVRILGVRRRLIDHALTTAPQPEVVEGRYDAPAATDLGSVWWFVAMRERGFSDNVAENLRAIGWITDREYGLSPAPPIQDMPRAGRAVDVRARRGSTTLLIECKVTQPWLGIGQVLYYAGLYRDEGEAVIPVVAAPASTWNQTALRVAIDAKVVPWPLDTHARRPRF